MNHYNCIYKLTSPSGKSYIGQTRNFNKRMNSYRTLINSKKITQPGIYNAISIYGFESFLVEILTENSNINHLNLYEMAFIRHYDTYNNGYNCTLGGDGVSKPQTRITRDKISKGLSGIKRSLVTRKRMSDSMTGRIRGPMSLDTKQKISNSNKGKHKTFTEEHKRNISLATSIVVPDMALDENYTYKKVIPHAFRKQAQVSEWHLQCHRMYHQIYRLRHTNGTK